MEHHNTKLTEPLSNFFMLLIRKMRSQDFAAKPQAQFLAPSCHPDPGQSSVQSSPQPDTSIPRLLYTYIVGRPRSFSSDSLLITAADSTGTILA
jgi:hypothetical protein